ncbi:hypothetical protein DEJ49_33110 [Streptomyces venezuelae]|uniref:Uncharacterized protein n=1 Tax=Streptomyces venezuelae TaxID=54571 RepID=A0A5P2CQK0_STRVZ|nr:hypothetical protein [Streptomyces venezuelae]QES45182.1 hypothetical protein DEJ49_33110 [Streptomyces venezuelae]
MDLFGKIHIANEHLATAGREGIVFTSRYKKPITDDVVVTAFHPTTGDGRSFLMTRAEVEELHGALGKWLDTGWAGFVDGAPGPGEGYPDSGLGTVQDARPVLDEHERQRAERAANDRRLEKSRKAQYAQHTRDELLDEIRLLKWNMDAAKRDEQAWRDAAARDRESFERQIKALRQAINGRKTVPVADLEAAIKEARGS